VSGPVDPRLLREAAPARRALGCAAALGLLTTALVLGQAVVLADLLSDALRGDVPDGRALVLLSGLLAARAGVAWLAGAVSARCSAEVKSELRMRLLSRSLEQGPAFLTRNRTGEVAALATRGVDALDPWFSRFLPQLVLSAAVPVAVIAVLATVDLLSAVVVACTVPLIPVFMVLVGLHTRSRTERSWAVLQALAGHFLDTVRGMPTLRVYGRARAQAASVRAITDEQRVATMAALRVAFLSALVLELLATLSVALVAVEVGLRLIHGSIDYEAALLVLLLAPEAYLPLRRVGAEYHASQEGAAASRKVFALLDELGAEARLEGAAAASTWPHAREGLSACALTLSFPGRGEPVLRDVSLCVDPGHSTAVTGPSGSGKSTLLAVLAGLRKPDDGTLRLDGVDLPAGDVERWRRRVAWLGQTPRLCGPVRDLVRLGDPSADDAAVLSALDRVGLRAFADAVVQEDGSGLSVGQQRRVCLARALLRIDGGAKVLLLDEPTQSLDPHSAGIIRDVVCDLPRHLIVVIATHDPALAARCDRVVGLRGGVLEELPTRTPDLVRPP
jgi:thiol reductant ABC exporter CydD subunit